VLQEVLSVDRDVARAATELRWGPVTAAFVLLSAWWVKSVLFVVAGAWQDVRDRTPPWTALTIAVAFGLSSVASAVVKVLVGRARPAFDPAIALPASDSFPSGHATTAFGAAVATAILVPRLRVPALVLAALVALSRVYLGVHFPLDVLAGALLGSLVGAAVALPRRAQATTVSAPGATENSTSGASPTQSPSHSIATGRPSTDRATIDD